MDALERRGEKRGRPGIIQHVLYVRMSSGHREGVAEPQISLKTADEAV